MDIVFYIMSGFLSLGIFVLGVARVYERFYMKQYYASIIEMGLWSIILVGHLWITSIVG